MNASPVPFVNLKAQYRSMANEIETAIRATLDEGAYINGPALTRLEAQLASYVSVRHAIGCSSGTDALLLALMAIDLQPGDEVITTPFTFVATAEAISLLKARPVFVDIEKDTFCIDPSQIEERITERTKAIIPVSLFGQCADMDAIDAIARRHNLVVIEDAAQSFGALYKGRRSCGLSRLACTSFYPAKPLGCYGDGGAVFTDDDALAKKIRSLLQHGQSSGYIYEYVGINGRLDTVQAAVLEVKLKRLDRELESRRSKARRYDEKLSRLSLKLPAIRPDRVSVFAQYSLLTDNRDELREKLRAAGVPTAVYYPLPLHKQKPYFQQGSLPVSERVSETILSLPICAYLEESTQDFVCESIKAAL